MKLTPEQALEKARQTYTEGVEYIGAVTKVYQYKVNAPDVEEYKIVLYDNKEYMIFAAYGKGTLYDSETDQWAKISVTQNPLEALKQQEAELLDKLADNMDKQRKIKLAEIEKEFGISVGDVIEHNGKNGIVSHIDADSANPFYYLPFKKDGKPSMKEVWCFGLDKIKLIEKK